MIDSTYIVNMVRKEVEALHCFFVEWFSGRMQNSDTLFQKGFSDRFDPDFLLIPPNGRTVSLGTLTQSIRNGYAGNVDFRIAIRNVAVRRKWDRYVLATYEEWQRNAKASTPPDNGRVASVVFEVGDKLKWMHIHETWLPTKVMQAGPYDF